MRKLGIFIALLLFTCSKTKTTTEYIEVPANIGLAKDNPDNLELVPISDIAQVVLGNDSFNKLIGGKPADPKNWPASFTTKQGNSRCTGTVIGPQTLQLAAHCVGNGKAASVTFEGKEYNSTCTHHPNYRSDSTSDYALCYLSEPISLKWYEVILSSGDEIKVGSEMILAGMGCTVVGGSGGGNDNIFRIGSSPIIRLPGSNNDIVTSGESALCFGDSGGSAFFKDSKGMIKVAGINSRGDIRKVSYLPAVYTASAQKFYKSWAESKNTKICGIHEDVEGCRKGEDVPPPPPPPPPPEPQPQPIPEWCAATFKKISECIFGEPRLSLTKPEECRDEYANLYACQVASELMQ